jgi:diacylglycerol kinase (ATP)
MHARSVQRDLVPAVDYLQRAGLRIIAVHPLRDEVGVEGAIRLARERKVKLIIAAGGDGTVGTVANHLANTDLHLGVLPFGTSNDFARSVGIPLSLEEACKTIVRGGHRNIDVGLMTADDGTRRYFVHGAIVGLNTQFAKLATEPQWRNRFGRLAYPVAALRAMSSQETIEMVITADSKRFHGNVVQVSILNAPNFGGAMGFRVPDSTLTDKRLDLLIVGRATPRVVARAVRAIVDGHRQRVPRTYVSHPQLVRIETDIPRDVTCDGELVAKTPITLTSVNRALTVIT